MMHPDNPRPPADLHEREADHWPLAVALVVIGPFAVVIAVAVLIALTS